MKNFNGLGSRVAAFVSNTFYRKLVPVTLTRSGLRRRVIVIGGGPVGLAFGTTLHELAGETVDITIADGRWWYEGANIRWRSSAEGLNRRLQFVTLQAMVYDRLPERVRSAMFPVQGYSEIWPNSLESPSDIGYPRNVRIRDIEDRLLDLARAQGLRLLAERIDPADISLDEWDLVVIADGANSNSRAYFAHAFGQADPTPYSLAGNQVSDTVIGLQVQSSMSAASSVVMTVGQNRFLFNGEASGEGLLYMRLTDEEATEVRGRVPGEHGFRSCSQSYPCMWQVDRSRGTFICERGSEFVPPNDSTSFLWPRVLEGLKLFDIPENTLRAITTFPLSMTRRGIFSNELTPTGSSRRVFGALLGDAAGVTHLWVGRGMNRGLSSAYALAVVMSRFTPGAELRSADFADFEGVMAQLQSRHQDRAWRAMVQLRDTQVVPTKAVIAGLIAAPRANRPDMLREMQARLADLSSRLRDRMPDPPVVAELFAALDRVDDQTLAVLAGSGPWEMDGSRGPEVDVDAKLGVQKAAEILPNQ